MRRWNHGYILLSPFRILLIILLLSPHILATREDQIHRKRDTTPIYTLHPRRSDSESHGFDRRQHRPKPEYVPHPASELVCRPFGECEPCPSDELDQPFCLPFGNRRLLHCLPASQAHDAGEGGDTRQPAGEVPAWEACGRVIRKERQDFWEFVTANMLFLIVALAILWGRSSALASAQYRQLAARIGIPAGNWRT